MSTTYITFGLYFVGLLFADERHAAVSAHD